MRPRKPLCYKPVMDRLLDKVALGYASVDDGVMEFSSPASITSSELETA